MRINVLSEASYFVDEAACLHALCLLVTVKCTMIFKKEKKNVLIIS